MGHISFHGRGGGGGGGGGGGSPAPAQVRTPDNLRSQDAFEIILGLGEGPIDACESFLVGDTPLNNADGSTNFSDFNLSIYAGDFAPTYVIKPTLGGISRGVNIGVVFFSGVPVTRTTQNGNIDFLGIRLAVQQLYRQDANGVYTNSLEMTVEYKPSSSSTWTNPYGGSITISGKTTSTYVKELRFPVSRISENYDIRITKLSPENDVDNFRVVQWESFQEITASQYTWPNTAIAHLTGRASNQFTSLPQFSGIYRGVKVKVPTNYDPITRTYSGTWDGTFKTAWTNNPAWCLYDFVTNGHYGIATYYPIFMDKYSVYEAGQWCDQIMSDGRPRYTFNQLISDPRSGREQALYMAGIFNAVFFDDQNGTASLRVDKEEAAIHLFAEENTIDGFSYASTDVNTRFNDITVTFTNPDYSYQEDRRRVFNQADIDLNGRIPHDFIAVGCDNAPEAVRRASFKLLTGMTETLMVSFKTNRRGLFVQPWDVMLIADQDLGYALSGRVQSLDGTRKVVTLRDPLYLEVGVSYTISFDYLGQLFETNLVAASSGNNYTLTLADALPSNLPEFCTFTVSGGLLGTPKPFRVLKVSEAEGNPDGIEINGIEINRNKWTQADNYTDTTVIQYSALTSPLVVPGPSTVAFSERFNKRTKQFELVVEPTLDRDAYRYYSGDFDVWSRQKGVGAYELRTLINGDTIVNHPAGLCEFKVLPKSYVGGSAVLGNVASYEFTVTNPADPPGNIPWLQVNNSWLHWTYPDPPLDFAGFELRYSLDGRLLWDTGVNATPGSLIAAPPFALTVVPQGVLGVMLKAVDYFGNYSDSAATVVLNLGDPIINNIIMTKDCKALGWLGTKSNATVSGGNLTADLVPGGSFYSSDGSHPRYSGENSANFYATPRLQLDYIDTLSLTSAAYLNIDAEITGGGYLVYYREYGAAPFYDGGSMYGELGGSMYLTNPWLPLSQHAWLPAGNYEIKLTVPARSQAATVSRWSFIVDVDDIVERFSNISVGSGGTRLPITKTYTSISVVNLTLQYDGGSSYTVRVLDKDPVLGPLVKAYDLTGAATTGHVDAVIEGYFA
jgi:predicted phage tail protein